MIEATQISMPFLAPHSWVHGCPLPLCFNIYSIHVPTLSVEHFVLDQTFGFIHASGVLPAHSQKAILGMVLTSHLLKFERVWTSLFSEISATLWKCLNTSHPFLSPQPPHPYRRSSDIARSADHQDFVTSAPSRKGLLDKFTIL